jgi:hypothetical protein
MDILLNHLKSPFSYSLPEGSKFNTEGSKYKKLSPTSKILSIACGIGVCILASRRTNVFGSAAFGAITFYATAGIFKARQIHFINSRIEDLNKSHDSSKNNDSSAVDEDETKDTDSDNEVQVFDVDGPWPENKKTVTWTPKSVESTFRKYLEKKEIGVDLVDSFLTDNVKDAMVKELTNIEQKHNGDKELRHSFIRELKGFYLEFMTIPEVFKISVKVTTGTSYTLSLASDTTIEQLRVLTFIATSVHPEKQRLIFAGQELKNEHAVSDYKISKDKMIQLVPRPGDEYWKYQKKIAKK